ncbi:MAG: GPR1/FUN34/YaaH family transporter [Streptosporangiaceae bacterium]
MAAVEVTPGDSAQHEVLAEASPAPAGLLAGDPLSVGLPSFIVGSVALGLVLVGMVPATAVGASLPIILAATAAGLFIATIWAVAVGQSAVACVFGVFAGFWLSYAVLVLGLTHNWFGIAATAVASTEELFLTAWLIAIVLLTLATLRLPLAFTGVLVLVDLALLLVLLGTASNSAGLLKVGGVVALVFAALGAYIFVGTAAQATGGAALPLGKPVLR